MCLTPYIYLDYTRLVDIKKILRLGLKKLISAKPRKELKIIPREAVVKVTMARETEKKTCFILHCVIHLF